VFAFALSSIPVSAQFGRTDEVKTYKGWTLHGKIISSESDTLIKIQTYDGNIFAFSKSEISALQKGVKRLSNYNYKNKGFSHYTEMGPQASRNNSSSGVNTSAFSFQTVNGYKFCQLVYLGVGVGIDLYATETYLPVFGSLRGDFVNKGFMIPYYFIDLGNGFNITSNKTQDGGLLFASGIGLKIFFNNNTGFLLSVGYRQQSKSPDANSDLKSYERLAIRGGFTF
jgi:hypothetical protein